MRITTRRAMRSTGFLVGLMAAGGIVADGWHAVAPVEPAAAVRVTVAPTGAIEVDPTGVLIDEPALRPSATADGEVQIRNITGVPLNVRLKARSEGLGLDDALALEVRAGEMLVFDDLLGELRGGATMFQLASGQSVTVSALAALADGRDAAGRSADVIVDLESVPEPSAS